MRVFMAGCVMTVAASSTVIVFPRPRAAAQPPADAPQPPSQKLLENVEVTPGGGANFYTTYRGKRRRSFSISPGGSLIAGGVSRAGTPLTDEPPVIDPSEYDEAGAAGGRNWIHDFYFGRFRQGDGQPRLYSRGMFLWGRGDSPDIQLGRTGPDNPKTTYGAPADTEPGSSLGKIVFLNWGEDEFQGDLARITARNETVATRTRNPGSLHFATAGPSAGTDAKKAAIAWRDGIDRLVIRSNGYVGIGDDFSGAAERLHVKGNIRADGNLQATGDVVVQGAHKVAVDHPTRPGEKLVHAAIVGPEAVVSFRGEGQLTNGSATIALPEYFEATTREGRRTVLLTNVDGFDPLAIRRQGDMQVRDGRFVVFSNRPDSTQRFTWEVKAVRADVGPLGVER